MQLLVLVLNKVEILDELLAQLSSGGVRGATIFHSMGMAHELANSEEEIPLFRTLSKMFHPDREESRTVMMVLEDAKVSVAKRIINEVTGGIEKPDTGILFSLPLNFVEGMVTE